MTVKIIDLAEALIPRILMLARRGNDFVPQGSEFRFHFDRIFTNSRIIQDWIEDISRVTNSEFSLVGGGASKDLTAKFMLAAKSEPSLLLSSSQLAQNEKFQDFCLRNADYGLWELIKIDKISSDGNRVDSVSFIDGDPTQISTHSAILALGITPLSRENSIRCLELARISLDQNKFMNIVKPMIEKLTLGESLSLEDEDKLTQIFQTLRDRHDMLSSATANQISTVLKRAEKSVFASRQPS